MLREHHARLARLRSTAVAGSLGCYLAWQALRSLGGLIAYADHYDLGARLGTPRLEDVIRVGLGPHYEGYRDLLRLTAPTDSVLYVLSAQEVLRLGSRLTPWFTLLHPRRLADIVVVGSGSLGAADGGSHDLENPGLAGERLHTLIETAHGTLYVVDFGSGIQLDWSQWGVETARGEGYRIWKLRARERG